MKGRGVRPFPVPARRSLKMECALMMAEPRAPPRVMPRRRNLTRLLVKPLLLGKIRTLVAARMFEAFASNNFRAIRVFRDVVAAETWPFSEMSVLPLGS